MTDPTPSGDPAPAPAANPESSKANALRDVGRGVFAGYVLAAMNAFLAWYIYDTGYGVKEAAGDDRIVIAASTSFMAVVAAALAYRFSRRHAIWIPIFFLSWFAFEVGAKFLNGVPTTGFLVLNGLVAIGLVSGLRGALSLRKIRAALDTQHG